MVHAHHARAVKGEGIWKYCDLCVQSRPPIPGVKAKVANNVSVGGNVGGVTGTATGGPCWIVGWPMSRWLLDDGVKRVGLHVRSGGHVSSGTVWFVAGVLPVAGRVLTPKPCVCVRLTVVGELIRTCAIKVLF